MIVRRLQREEWSLVEGIFKEQFSENPPHPDAATIVVAEEGGQVVALLTLQQVLHIEPLWVRESHRGRYIIPLLVKKVTEIFPSLSCVYAYTTSDRVGKLMERLGMKALKDWRTFRWVR